jgi:hypothetical protein
MNDNHQLNSLLSTINSSDETNPHLVFNTVPTALLVAFANGVINVSDLVSQQLRARGLDQQGKWVGMLELPKSPIIRLLQLV